jgi:hypothetical protein
VDCSNVPELNEIAFELDGFYLEIDPSAFVVDVSTFR